MAWRERRFAASCAREMLALQRQLAAQQPQVRGRALYRRIVAARLSCDDAAADEVLQRAEQSFAIWPVPRTLCYRDVVHYIAVSRFIAAHPGAHWVYADMKHIVDRVIPHDL